MIITLGGKLGAGKSTVSAILCERHGYEYVSIGGIKRKLAKEMGMTILEFDQIGWNDPEKAKEYDLKYEDYQQSLSLDEKIILDSKMSFYCQPEAFNVFLEVSDEVGAQRIFDQQRDDDESSSYEAVLEANRVRMQGQQDTYRKLYEVDLFDMSHYDLVVDATHKTPEEVVTAIEEGLYTYIASTNDN